MAAEGSRLDFMFLAPPPPAAKSATASIIDLFEKYSHQIIDRLRLQDSLKTLSCDPCLVCKGITIVQEQSFLVPVGGTPS